MYLVVGTGRSGTSSVARVLHERLGVNMGGPGRRTESNPRGDYERKGTRRISLEYLRGYVSLAEWRDGVRKIAGSLKEPWGVKFPPSAYMLDEWFRLFPDARTIWAQRDLTLTANSMMRWYGFTEHRARFEVGSRLHLLTLFLRDRDVLEIDFTGHLSDEEIVARLTNRWSALNTTAVSP